jgi:hypothetical protein
MRTRETKSRGDNEINLNHKVSPPTGCGQLQASQYSAHTSSTVVAAATQLQTFRLRSPSSGQAGGQRKCQHQWWRRRESRTTSFVLQLHGQTGGGYEIRRKRHIGCSSSSIICSTCASSWKNLRATGFPPFTVSCALICDCQHQ